MNSWWLALALLYPLAGVIATLIPRTPALVVRVCLATLALPALAVALFLPSTASLEVPWLLLGGTLSLTETSRVFLLFTALLWSLAGIYSLFYTARDPRFRAYTVYFLLSFTGNAGLFLVTDMPLFYTAFALMTFSAYGLVVHNRSQAAIQAGQLYIGMAVFGELLVLSGLLWLTFASGAIEIAAAPAALAALPHGPWLIGLLLFGFGVKAGLLPVHGWLPLAHPVAPTPASAVLSGAMIKAGLYAWLILLPGGMASYPGWGWACILLGLGAAFGAAYAGFTQQDPKANLAYSSISQMGVMTLTLGVGLVTASAWDKTIGLLTFYAIHHACAKGALFLAVGAAQQAHTRTMRLLVLLGCLLVALSIAGAPLTSGEMAKTALKKLVGSALGTWSAPFGWLLIASAFATTVLLGRFLYLIVRSLPPTHTHGQDPAGPGILWSWGLAVLVSLSVPWWALQVFDAPLPSVSFSLASLVKAWPILLGSVAAGVLVTRVTMMPTVPPGDLGQVLLTVGKRLVHWWVIKVAPRLERKLCTADWLLEALTPPEPGQPKSWLDRMDLAMQSPLAAGSLILTLLILLWWSASL